jgi:hopene-associated glycosyltransferase HpnB
MNEAVLVIAVVCVAAWLYLLTLHGAFWRSRPVLDAGTPSGRARVAVVVAARDEAENIRASLGSLLAQQYAGELAVILVDDNSSDGTAQIASQLDTGGHLTIIQGAPLPSGWTGKLWAVHQGLAGQQARAAEYVLLTDADIVHAPDHVAALVARAERDNLDLVSEMVHLNCSTWAERALIPAFVFFFQMLYPFAWVADPRKRTAGAAGGTMLVARAALDRAEGVSRIRHELIDDCALAGQIKRSGGRLWLGHSEGTVSRRVYATWREVADMIARTAYVQLGRSPLLLLGCMVGMSVLYLWPPLLAAMGRGLPQMLGALAWLLMAIAFQPTLHRYRRSPLWGLALPAIALFYLGATIASAMRHSSGRGGGWKNRVYPENR